MHGVDGGSDVEHPGADDQDNGSAGNEGGEHGLGMISCLYLREL